MGRIEYQFWDLTFLFAYFQGLMAKLKVRVGKKYIVWQHLLIKIDFFFIKKVLFFISLLIKGYMWTSIKLPW